MDTVMLDGRTLAAKIRDDLQVRVEKMVGEGFSAPTLATVLVGDNPASATYVNMKTKSSRSVGMWSKQVHLPASAKNADLLRVIDDLNADPSLHGILLQHPTPPEIDERAAFDRIAADRDVDGVTTLGFGRLCFSIDAYPCCTPAGIIRLLDEYNIPLRGMNAVVVGCSPILGRPMAMMLVNRECTVTMCHIATKNLQGHLAQADLVVAALGQPRFIKGEWLKDGVIVIDAGYHPQEKTGDTDFESCSQKASYITPVPGGVGPMTIAMLLAHTVEAAERRHGMTTEQTDKE